MHGHKILHSTKASVLSPKKQGGGGILKQKKQQKQYNRLTWSMFNATEYAFHFDTKISWSFVERITNDFDNFLRSYIPFWLSEWRLGAIFHFISEQVRWIASLYIESIMSFTILTEIIGNLV